MQEIAALLSQAHAELSRQQPETAAQRLREVLERDPDHVAALRGLASIALQRGDYAMAVSSLRRLVGQQPANGEVRQGLAIALAQSGDPAGACEQLRELLSRSPESLSARLHLGMYLLDQNLRDEACTEFSAALGTLSRHSGGMVTPQVQHLVGLARSTIRDAQLGVYRTAVAELRATHGDEALQRIDACVDIYLHRRAPDYAHPKQRPGTMYIPGLQPRAFFEREEFEWIGQLEAATAVIREELLALLAVGEDAGFEPYVQLPPDHPQAGAWAAVNNATDWSALHLWRHGQPIAANAARCPRTMAVLDSLPLMRIPQHAPEVVLSVLKPGAHIPPHYGSVNGRLIVHLPLVVPPNCGALCANGEMREWQEGRCLIFDDSFVHEAWNNSDQTRVVMLLDIWNPQLEAVEREAFSAALASIDAFNVRVLRRKAQGFA